LSQTSDNGQCSHGWGREGHRIVADIAQERLTEVTKRNVRSLIGNNTLASVEIRPERDEGGYSQPNITPMCDHGHRIAGSEMLNVCWERGG